MASEHELNDFLKSVEKRAFKRSLYQTKDTEAALDIVQDSMLKLARHYGDKPVAELPLLFQQILVNTTMDWFRARKPRQALFSNFSDLETQGDRESEGEFNLLEVLASEAVADSAQDLIERTQVFYEIEKEIKKLSACQREAFLMRYWEEMDLAETAAAMGCTEGSVKVHCTRAVARLSRALIAKGIKI